MAVVVNNDEELGKALKNNSAEIEISSNALGEKVLKIKGTGDAAWGVAIAAIAIAIAAVIGTVATGGVAAPVAAPAALLSAGPAVAILGGSTVTSAIAIGVAAGGVGALNKLRDYDIEKRNGKVILKKK